MSTAVIDAPIAHATVQKLRAASERVEQIKNDAPQNFPEAASIGDAVRQGDIYIQRIADVTETPALYTLTKPEFPMQLADGNTKGSRHCLAHGNGATVYTPVDSNSREMLEALAKMRGISTNEPGWQNTLREAQWAEARDKVSNRPISAQEAVAMLEFAGPIFCLTETNTVTHPEHGDWILPPGTYRVTYQRTMSRENTIARVLD